MSSSEESNISQPTLIVSDPIIVKRPNPYIYILTQDGDHVCFSSSIKGIRKVIDSRVALLGLSYIGQNISRDDYHLDDMSVNVYVEHSNFLFRYFRIISEFEILRIPHYRFELAKSTKKSKAE